MGTLRVQLAREEFIKRQLLQSVLILRFALLALMTAWMNTLSGSTERKRMNARTHCCKTRLYLISFDQVAGLMN